MAILFDGVDAERRLHPLAPGPRAGRVRVVALGGGTGIPVLLRGLKAALFPPDEPWVATRDRNRLTAIVTAADDGGSSGQLRRQYRLLPPGDIRNCLMALADADPTLTDIFDFRFGGHGGVGGHSLGNLILAALSHLESDFLQAVKRAHELLAVRGQVLPATLEDVRLRAEFTDGSWVEGESRIATMRRSIGRVWLHPHGARTLPEALAAIAAADVVVIGPGSLYTSLLPVLLVRELGHALARSRARVVLAMNLMTEPGETDGYTLLDFVAAMQRHAPEVSLDDVLVNTAPIPGELVDRYAAQGARPVVLDEESFERLGCRVIGRDLLGLGPQVRHDPDKLARAILDLALEVSR